ncbi:MAG: CPBP family intramembrane metalloprotease [Bacteroidales bacterium]|nr:CPBP family intramembrane metalloprotease [Bacteroidales bacterium]
MNENADSIHINRKEKQSVRYYIRSIALAVVFVTVGQLIVIIITKLSGLELSKAWKSIIVFIITSAFAIFLFPGILKIPFGKVTIKTWLNRLGVYWPRNITGHILLGIMLACVSLTGMLLGSIFTGKYVVDFSNLTLGQFIFCLNPGIWEEVFFRGVILFVLIRWWKNLRKAMWWQILIFATCHITGYKLIDFVEFFSVALIGYTFTYVAVKSRTLIAGMMYHYLHDSFLYFVQVPGAEYHGFVDNFTFYAFLWAAMLINILIVAIVTEKAGLKGHNGFMVSEEVNDSYLFPYLSRKNSQIADRLQRYVLLLAGISVVPLIIEMMPSGISILFILIIFTALLNMGAFIFYNKIGEKIISIALMINGICQIVSGYQSHLGGSERAYIIYFLAGTVYIILGIFSYVIRKSNIPA